MKELLKCLLWGAGIGLPALALGTWVGLWQSGGGFGSLGIPATVLLWPVVAVISALPRLAEMEGSGMLVVAGAIQVVGYMAAVAVLRWIWRSFGRKQGPGGNSG